MHWFAAGLNTARQQIAYLNNYALLLSSQGCPQAATVLLDEALRLAPGNANLLDSQKQIRQQTGANNADSQTVHCPAIAPVNNLTHHQ